MVEKEERIIGKIVVETPGGGTAIYGSTPQGGMVLGTKRGGEGRLSPGAQEAEKAMGDMPGPPGDQAPSARRTIEYAGVRGLKAWQQQQADRPANEQADPDLG
jgi:hypothetical protein